MNDYHKGGYNMNEEQRAKAKPFLISVLAAALGYACFGPIGLILVLLYFVVKKF